MFWIINSVIALKIQSSRFCNCQTVSKIEKKKGVSDPPEIVVDEFCGQILCLLGSNLNIENLALGFFIFRLLDILKPPPIKYLETFPGGWGIFLDDLFSGLIGFLVLFFLRSLI